ncbi:hypothetical protein TURU_015686 [Turdus rufiventris]|nr:hypothetical protein TURU_015686 [Turdus rufiventris]
MENPRMEYFDVEIIGNATLEEVCHAIATATGREVKVLTSHVAAREDFQQVIGNEDPHGRCGARWLSQVELLQDITGASTEPAEAPAAAQSKGTFAPPTDNWSPRTTRFIFIQDTAAAQEQEIQDDPLEQQRRMMNMEKPRMEYTDVENTGNRKVISARAETATAECRLNNGIWESSYRYERNHPAFGVWPIGQVLPKLLFEAERALEFAGKIKGGGFSQNTLCRCRPSVMTQEHVGPATQDLYA